MRALYTVVLVLISPYLFAQSPWVPGKGKGFVQVGLTTIGPYSTLFSNNSSGSFPLTREVSDRTIQLYGEYGMAEKTGLVGVVPMKMLTTGVAANGASPTTDEGSFGTFGNLELGVRHNFINKKILLSGQLLLELPTSSFDANTGLRGGVDALRIAPSLSVGGSFDKLYGYLSLGAGIRTNDYSSELKIGGELGYEVLKRIYVILVLDLVENLENGKAIPPATQAESGLYLNNQSYFAYGLKGLIGFSDHIGITGAFYGAGGGNLVAKAPSINLGVYYKW